MQWSNSWLCIDTIRHQSVAGPVQQEVTCGEKQIKASDYNSSYLVGFQSVSTGFSAAALAKAEQDSIQ